MSNKVVMFEKQGERETTFHMSELLSLLRGLETDDLSTTTVEGQHFFHYIHSYYSQIGFTYPPFTPIICGVSFLLLIS